MKPKPLVALNHFTVPMLTGVVPSQDKYIEAHSHGLVRSNFWKGRQRLNRLYRWIANVVRPKIDGDILCETGFQNNPEAHDFLIGPFCICNPPTRADTRVSCARSGYFVGRLPAPELAARRCTTRCSATTRPLVLVAENEAALLQVVG